MKTVNGFKVLILIVAVCLSLFANGQGVDSAARANTIKVDLTSYWLYRNALVVSYERNLKNNQTLAITGGLQQFPTLYRIDSTILITSNSRASGYKVGAEYRYYLTKENKYAAPHGIYLGAYLTFHHFFNERTIEVNENGSPEVANLTARINILNPGIQLGYQFVINNRWTIDMTFLGPSISNYSAKFTLDGNFNFDPDNVENKFVQAIMDRYPGLAKLIKENEVSGSGHLDTWGYGFRYQLLVGYHFGRKKH